jgi:hypothetical protein
MRDADDTRLMRRSLVAAGAMIGASALFVATMTLLLAVAVDRAVGDGGRGPARTETVQQPAGETQERGRGSGARGGQPARGGTASAGGRS